MLCRFSVLVLLLCAQATTSRAADSSLTVLEDKLSELVFQASRSIVTIESVTYREDNHSSDQVGETVRRLISSGIVFDDEGHILTSAAAVTNRDRLNVWFEGQVHPADLVGIDYHTGLALVRVDGAVGVPVCYGQWQGCAGQMVIAVGNSYGIRASPSFGFCAGSKPDGTLQFSAHITSGTVGGGIFDLKGNLVGAITGGIGEGQFAEAGLAVHSADLQSVVSHLLEHGDRPAGFIGITAMDIDVSPGMEISFSSRMTLAAAPNRQVIDRGVMVTDVIRLSPAENTGLRKGDLLFSLNGELIKSASDLRCVVRKTTPGELIEIGFLRDRTPYVIPIQVGRVELTAFEGFDSQRTSSSVSSPLQDSLFHEIQQLKKTIYQLEAKLRSLQ